jgi:glycosyltransferase involved in cell wall biosynthesis
LIARAVGALADSSFNADELRALGMTNIAVVPPALNLRRLIDAEVDQALTVQLAEAASPLVLCVGQLLPHKRPDLAIAAHHLLNVNYVPDARLVLAGTPRDAQYASALNRYVDSLNLPTVWLTGEITDSQLAAFYRRADVLVVPSEHEGFGVPVIEAFHFGVPVIVRDIGALKETVRGAALVLDTDAGAPHLCEATARVLRDEHLRDELRRRGRLVASSMTPERTVADTLSALLQVLTDAPAPSVTTGR